MRGILRLVLLNVASTTIILCLLMPYKNNTKAKLRLLVLVKIACVDHKYFSAIEFMSDLKRAMFEHNRCHAMIH